MAGDGQWPLDGNDPNCNNENIKNKVTGILGCTEDEYDNAFGADKRQLPVAQSLHVLLEIMEKVTDKREIPEDATCYVPYTMQLSGQKSVVATLKVGENTYTLTTTVERPSLLSTKVLEFRPSPPPPSPGSARALP